MGKKKCRNLEGIKLTLKGALEEYKPDILEDSEDLYKLKSIIQNDLQEVDKIIFLAYVELRSFTELSKVLGISPVKLLLDDKTNKRRNYYTI